MGTPHPIVVLMLADNGGTTSHCHSHACERWGHHIPLSFSCLPTMGASHPIIILMLANDGGTTSHHHSHACQRWGHHIPLSFSCFPMMGGCSSIPTCVNISLTGCPEQKHGAHHGPILQCEGEEERDTGGDLSTQSSCSLTGLLKHSDDPWSATKCAHANVIYIFYTQTFGA